jgi:hypothetical protein
LAHNKYAVFTFLSRIIKEVQSKHKLIDNVTIFSDGCAAQFKNKYTLSNLCFMKEDHSVTLSEWNFFATSHGKGTVDAIGGLVKRMVWLEVKSRRVNVTDAKQFYLVARSKLTKVRVLYVSSTDIENEETTRMLDARWSNVKPIPHLQAKHHFKAINRSDLLYSQTAYSKSNCVMIFEF